MGRRGFWPLLSFKGGPETSGLPQGHLVKKIKWPTSQIEANRGTDYLRIPSAVQGMGERDGVQCVGCMWGCWEEMRLTNPLPRVARTRAPLT